MRGPRAAMKSGPRLLQLEKALAQKRRPNTAINKLKKKKSLIQGQTMICCCWGQDRKLSPTPDQPQIQAEWSFHGKEGQECFESLMPALRPQPVWHQGPVSWKTIFPQTGGGGWFLDDSSASHLLCTLFLLLLHCNM